MSPRSIREKAPISRPATSGVPVPATAWAMSLVTRSEAPIFVMPRPYTKSAFCSARPIASVKKSM